MSEENRMRLVFSTDINDIAKTEYRDWCLHLICNTGTATFTYNEAAFVMKKNDVVVITHNKLVKLLHASDDISVEILIAPIKTLKNLLPSNNYSVGGGISLFGNPVMSVSDYDAGKFLDDIHFIRKRMNEETNIFYNEMMAGLLLTMMYDLFEFHAKLYANVKTTYRTSFLVDEMIKLLDTGVSRRERKVAYYADRLHVSPKYLSKVVKRVTGDSVMFLIVQYTIPILTEYMHDDKLSFTQISNEMNFASLSYFSRYVTKHLGMTPSQYRQSISPKK